MSETISRDESWNYYTDLANYAPPSVTSHTKQFMVGCMHPTPERRTRQRNKIQTPGGGYGVTTDRQLVALALGHEPVSTQNALIADTNSRNTSTLDIHHGCAFWKYLPEIATEMSSPDHRTLSTVDRWLEEIYFRDNISRSVIDDLILAAEVYAEELPQQEQTDNPELIDLFDSLHPDKKNVQAVEPIVCPVGIYVVSHLVSVVQNQSHRDLRTSPAYFDSLGALVSLTDGHGDDIDPEMATYLHGAKILRSAATRTVINDKSSLELLEVTRRGKAIKFDLIELGDEDGLSTGEITQEEE